jgi:hypothetical protein
MSENTIKELFRNLERTVSDRLKVIDDLLRAYEGRPAPNSGPTAPWQFPASGALGPVVRESKPSGPEPWAVALLERISSLEAEVHSLRSDLDNTRGPLIPQYPMNGLEVVPKKEVVLTETGPEPLSVADRLLLNTSALKALEQEEEESVQPEEYVEEQEEQEEYVEQEEQEEQEQEDAEELEEFEYKGSTYYRDADKNVFMADDEGELVTTPVGVWSEVKKRIITKKGE